MAGAREEPDGCHALGVSCPLVDGLLGQVALLWRQLRLEIHVQVLGYVKVGSTLVVVRILDW